MLYDGEACTMDRLKSAATLDCSAAVLSTSGPAILALSSKSGCDVAGRPGRLTAIVRTASFIGGKDNVRTRSGIIDAFARAGGIYGYRGLAHGMTEEK